MNFVQQLEECLRDLAAEARKKHPGVKEASERATLKLRSLQAGYVSAVRKAASNDAELHPTTALFQSSDLLHPFLLAANYPNADYKLLEISFRAMRLLMEADAVVPTDGIHMVRVYQIQAHVVTAYYQKHYAKEIQKAKANEQEDAASSQTETANENTSSSGWFSWGSSSSSSNTKSSLSSHDGKVAMKNVVSSSTGQTGQTALSGTHMEKLALEILSSLLQLMELLRNYPSSLTMEIWTNSVSLACLWLQHYLPARHTVQQAAHSTVSQIISLLYQTADEDDVGARSKLIQYTWEDLLVLTDSERKRSSTARAVGGMQGAFKLCKRGDPTSATSVPPSPEFALELMTQVWKEKTKQRNQFEPSDALLVKSMGVTMNLLQQIPKQSVEKSLRVVQWTLALFQSHANTYPNECRELFLHLIKQIPAATDACRKHHDFEDGYVYSAQGDKEFASSSAATASEDSSSVSAAVTKELSKRKLLSQSLATVFPSPALWKAGFVLEAAYHILDKDSNELSVLFEDRSTIQALAEALSDFATIGSSCQDHILQVVDFCQRQNPSSIKPTVFRKAEQALATGANFSGGPAKSSSKSSDKKKGSAQILGESIWLALQGVLRIGDCLLCIKSEEERTGLLEEVFSPSLALLQHFLKRIVGSDEVVRLALNGYSTLADICLPMEACSLQRKVLLTSLSKLSLPSWGKHDSSCLLQDHHVRSLLCLLRIVHLHFNSIANDWEIILWTFEELSVLSIASPLLSDEAYHASLAISAAFARFASFSTSFSDESIIHMVEALSEICRTTMAKRDVVGDSDTVLPERAAAPDIAERDSAEERETISGKIMSIGVRALYGSASSDVGREDDMQREKRTKSAYYQDYQNDFLGRISNSRSTVRTNSLGRLPFSLMLLSDVAMANLFRGIAFGTRISTEIYGLAAASPAIRPFVMDMMTMMIMCQLSTERDLPLVFEGRGRVVFEDPMHSQLLAVEPVEGAESDRRDGISQADVIAPLCESIQHTKNADVAKSSLGVLTSILEGTGQNLQGEVWSMLIDAVASLSGDPSYQVDRSSSEWSACCLMAFRTLKLIVDDFLEQLPSAADTETTAHISLLDCCSSFVVSRHDINTSLTAIGLLWTIADQDSDSAAIDRALSKLVLLSSDDRPEVRNAAVNTLFSCIVGRGSSFSSAYWKSCINGTIFGVYDIVAGKGGERGAGESSSNGDSSSRYSVSMHHTRNSSGKMWLATQVLVLRGLARVMRTFFTQLLDTIDTNNSMERGDPDSDSWFQAAWLRIINFAFEAASQGAGRDNLDIRSIGVELLVVCCQLASKAGIQAAVTPARVSTNMEVVNGALRSVRDSQPTKVSLERTHSEATELARQKLFLEAFNSLVAFDKEVLKQLTDPDDTDIQILNRLCAGLSRLYDCCRGNELMVDSTTRSLQKLSGVGSKAETSFEVDLESRFVGLVVSVLEASGGDPKARFLNQGERSSLDLLRSMASDGSSIAFEKLVYFAGKSFFIRKDSDADGSESGEEDSGTKPHATLLNFEAASAVAQELPKDSVSDVCRLYVLYMILANFLGDYEVKDGAKMYDPKQRRYYKRFVPIIRSALESAARLSGRSDADSFNAITLVWDQVLKCLSHMLTPIPLGNDMMKISRVHEIILVVKFAVLNVPKSYTSKLCEQLSFGATKAFDAAQQHALHAQANPESDFGRKSKRHRDDLLKLFSACLSGSCALEPEEDGLRHICETVLRGALSTTQDAIRALCVDASLLVCGALQENQNMEALVISIFPTLCRLILSDSRRIRDAAGSVLTSVNISETLQLAQTRYQDAERRAVEAEERVNGLQATIEALRLENGKLQQKIKRSDSGRGLWSLG